MASSIAAITIPRSMDFSRATASAICRSSILLALTAAMVLVSFACVEFATPRFVGGKAMFLRIVRWRLLLQFRFRRMTFGRVAFCRMRRRRRHQPEILLQLALGELAAAHRFRDQLV